MSEPSATTSERFTLTPERYALIARVALWTLTGIVLTGAAVRVTGSGLGCPTWPKCTDQSLYTELNTHGLIEFGNRMLTSVVGFACIAAFAGAFRRRPRRRDLVRLSALLPLGVVAQIVLGGFTVRYDLRPGFVMSHYLLSMLIIVAAVALDWRAHRAGGRAARAERPARRVRRVGARAGGGDHDLRGHGGERGRPARRRRRDRRRHQAPDVQGRRHAALRHRAARAPRDAARPAGGRAVGAGAPPRRDERAGRPLTWVCVLLAAQGVIGGVQYKLELPAEIVWVHVTLAALTWVAILVSVAAVGKPLPRGAPSRASGEPAPAP